MPTDKKVRRKKIIRISILFITIICVGAIGVYSYLFVLRPMNDPLLEQAGFGAAGLSVSFDFNRPIGRATNQFAVWIEDMDGNHIRTLYVTSWTADVGYRTRPTTVLPTWLAQSGRLTMHSSEVDAISGPTPQSSKVRIHWDLTDADGSAVPQGQYRFVIEGNLRWYNRVIYSGIVDTGGGSATIHADAEFIFEGSGLQYALNENSSDAGMITGVQAVFMPK